MQRSNAGPEIAGVSTPDPLQEKPAESAQLPIVRNRVVDLSPGLAERNRILPAGAGGANGPAYKMLRTQVVKRLDQLRVNSMAVLGPTRGSGTTLTAINLAIAVAAERARNVLLVDFNLKRPQIHRLLGVEPVTGLDDCLAGGRPFQDAMVEIRGYDRLQILPARLATDNSSEVISDQRTIEAINALRTQDPDRLLIFDLPAVLEADDALAFVRYVQSGLLVVCEGVSRREDVSRSMNLIREIPILGTMLNRSRESAGMHY